MNWRTLCLFKTEEWDIPCVLLESDAENIREHHGEGDFSVCKLTLKLESLCDATNTDLVPCTPTPYKSEELLKCWKVFRPRAATAKNCIIFSVSPGRLRGRKAETHKNDEDTHNKAVASLVINVEQRETIPLHKVCLWHPVWSHSKKIPSLSEVRIKKTQRLLLVHFLCVNRFGKHKWHGWCMGSVRGSSCQAVGDVGL